VLTLRLNNTFETRGQVEYIVNEDSRIIVVKITKNVEALVKHRKIIVDIIWWNDEGLKVPNFCLLYNGDKVSVIRVRAGYTDKIMVKVIRKNEDYSIIENYTVSELKELGYTMEEIENLKNISIYDQIRVNPTIDMVE